MSADQKLLNRNISRTESGILFVGGKAKNNVPEYGSLFCFKKFRPKTPNPSTMVSYSGYHTFPCANDDLTPKSHSRFEKYLVHHKIDTANPLKLRNAIDSFCDDEIKSIKKSLYENNNENMKDIDRIAEKNDYHDIDKIIVNFQTNEVTEELKQKNSKNMKKVVGKVESFDSDLFKYYLLYTLDKKYYELLRWLLIDYMDKTKQHGKMVPFDKVYNFEDTDFIKELQRKIILGDYLQLLMIVNL